MEKNTAFDLLFETGLRHLYKAENEVFEALASMAKNAKSSLLNLMLLHHRDETHTQIERLKTVFALLDINIHSTKLRGMQDLTAQGKELFKTLLDFNFTDRSRGMDGIVTEGKELIRHFKDTEAADFALISAGNKVENFEIGCYLPLCTLAEKFGEQEILHLLSASLKEEQAMEEKLRLFGEKEVVLTRAVSGGF